MKNLSKELGMADGGEVDEMSADDDMNDMVADEVFDAMEKKDKRAFIDGIRALIMNMGEK
jgi:hypothetical protein